VFKNKGVIMDEETIVLAASSSYDRKYYYNQEFGSLPETIKEDIQVMLVSFTMEIGGVLTLSFNEEGTLMIETECDEDDILYDEIGAHLKIKQITQTHQELFGNLEMFFKVFYLGEEVEE